jgi:thiol-disulfide isomerase/thioredoxin
MGMIEELLFRKMKICLYNVTTAVKTGGIETFCWEMGKVLSQLGYQPGGPKAFIETLEESVTFKEKHKEDVYVDEGGLTWFLSLEKAEEIASKEHKPIFVNFTGSDWCVWCKKLYNEVFSKPEFIEYAKENLVLLRFDFPRQTPQSAGLKAYNQQMILLQQQIFQLIYGRVNHQYKF